MRQTFRNSISALIALLMLFAISQPVQAQNKKAKNVNRKRLSRLRSFITMTASPHCLRMLFIRPMLASFQLEEQRLSQP